MSHTMKAFDDELDALKREIASMGALTLDMVSRAVESLALGSAEKATDIISCDHRIDELQRSIEQKAIITIARRQPEADDLRHLVGAIRIACFLERVGDYAKNIAERLVKMAAWPPASNSLLMAEPLGKAACRQLSAVIKAFESDDAVKAEAIWRSDEGLDAMGEAAFRYILTTMINDPVNISYSSQVIFCYNHLQRIGDYVRNIAKIVVYMSSGRQLEQYEHETTA